jgi:hypothetical protein
MSLPNKKKTFPNIQMFPKIKEKLTKNNIKSLG